MRNRIARGVAGVAAAVLALTTIGAGGPADAAPQKNRSLVKVLAADGSKLDKNWRDFDIVEAAVGAVLEAKPRSAVGVLAKGRTRLTAFVPTDAAFRRLVRDLTGTFPKTERATLRKIVKNVDVATIETILLYHVVPGRTLGSGKVVAADGKRLKTAQGARIGVHLTESGRVRLVDRDHDDRDPRAINALLDINKGNKQIAHGINRVLRPVDL